MTDTELARAVLVLADDRPLFDGYEPTGLVGHPDVVNRPNGRHYTGPRRATPSERIPPGGRAGR